ncbi:MAG TPA: FtsK/SpoIIIE domain-containing protein [Frankiaceae bacterium]|nr:FtsK/SpoIIIE domain-containing protein [Frankiaceae bacterium]
MPVGVDDDGLPVTVRLPEHHVLAGGESGSGKSTAVQQLLATVALDPAAELWAVDGKELELACWEGAATRSVGANVRDAIDLLAELQEEVSRRIGYLKRLSRAQRLPRRKLGPGDGLPLIVLVIDELACFLLLAEDAEDRRRFRGLLLDLLNRARAVGIVIVAATQKPSGAVIPTEIRDGFGVRWAFRTTTRDASDTILGAGWAALGYSSHTIDAATRGVGLLLADGQLPVRLRAHEITDTQLADLAARATTLRGRTPTVSLAVGATVPLPRPDGAPAGALSLSDAGDADAYLSDDELTAEWAAFARAYQQNHPPDGDGAGGPPA